MSKDQALGALICALCVALNQRAWTMATTPPPKPIEETQPEQTEEKTRAPC